MLFFLQIPQNRVFSEKKREGEKLKTAQVRDKDLVTVLLSSPQLTQHQSIPLSPQFVRRELLTLPPKPKIK